MNFDVAITDYSADLKISKFSAATIRQKTIQLRAFARYCEEHNVSKVEELSKSILKEYTLELIERGNKGSSINEVLKKIQCFLYYLWNEYEIPFNPAGAIKLCKTEKSAFQIFSKKDVKQIISNCTGSSYLDIRDKTIITLLFETGVRCNEVCSMKADDIKENYILIHGKGSKERLVPITTPLRKALLRYEIARERYFSADKKRTDFYFLNMRGSKLTVDVIEKTFNRRGEGISNVRVSPHSARHFFAIHMLKNGVDVYTISRLLGHSNLSITDNYLQRLGSEDIVKEAQKVSVLMNLQCLIRREMDKLSSFFINIKKVI